MDDQFQKNESPRRHSTADQYRAWVAIQPPGFTSERAKEWRRRNPQRYKYHSDKSNAGTAEQRRMDPRIALIRAAKKRADKRGLPCTITVEDIPIPATCPVLGIPLQVGRGRYGPGSPTLDRIDNARGYVPGNVAVISYRANTIKSDSTISEIAAIFQYMAGCLDTSVK